MLAGGAQAAPGQCSMTGYDSFDCAVGMDGAGLTFALPDGQTFVFALVEEGEGLGYLIAADAAPGERPDELGTFTSDQSQPGCWISERDEDDRFCVMVAE
jgi:hypothetical protein